LFGTFNRGRRDKHPDEQLSLPASNRLSPKPSKEKLLMNITSVRRILSCALLCMIVAICSAQVSLAQDASQSRTGARDDQTNLDLELYMIIATNQTPREGRIPAALDPLVKQLRETLPFKNYSVETTMVNRIRNGGSLSLSWFVGPPTNSTSTNRPPIFNDFSIGQLKLVLDGNGGQAIQLFRFAFGSRVPIQTSTTIAASGVSAPIFNYEQLGIKTDISVRDGQPAVVGTLLNASAAGDAIVLAVCAKHVMN
jgi:hypothetical protein